MKSHIADIIKERGELTKSKGFDVTHIRCQLLLIISEAVEALELTTPSGDTGLDFLVDVVTNTNQVLEHMRKTRPVADHSKVTNYDDFLEELVDIETRLHSMVHGNGWTDDYLQAAAAKHQKNQNRPAMHGNNHF